MKTKFDPILQIKQQQLDQALAVLMKLKQKSLQIKNTIDELFSMIENTTMPQGGDFAVFAQQKHMLQILKEQKSIFEKELEDTQMKIAQTQRLCEHANKELEKIAYLKQEEIKQKMTAIKKQQQKDLDEIALLLYGRKEN